MQIRRHGWRWGFGAVTVVLAGLLAACASGSSTTVTGTPTPLPRGAWIRPAFPSVTTPTVSSVAFADANQQQGYACTATLGTTTVGTPTPTTTGTPAATATPAPTATGIPGRPTEPVQIQNIVNGLFGTSDGGVTWQALPLPTAEPKLICPLSAIVAPDLADPADVFFLAAVGDFDLGDPTSILPGKVQFELWRSRDAGKTWQRLAVPTAPNPVSAILLSPFHLFMSVAGDNLAFGTNYSGQNQLFTSSDAGKTWQLAQPISVTAGGKTAARPYLALAGGANGAILALTNNAGASGEKPLSVWSSSDGAKTWKRRGDFPATMATGATLTGQLFAAPGGQTIYGVVHASATTSDAKAGPVMVARSTDGGTTWTAIPWPTGADNAPLGGALIGQLGIDFAVDAKGDAFAAPTVNDLSAQQDATGQQSAGFYEVAAGATQFSKVGQAPAAQETAFGLAVSLVPASALQPPSTSGTATVTTTGTSAATATATVAPTATPAATGTPAATTTPAPTGTPTTDGLPTLWSNFGPLTQFTTAPDTAGLLANVLP